MASGDKTTMVKRDDLHTDHFDLDATSGPVTLKGTIDNVTTALNGLIDAHADTSTGTGAGQINVDYAIKEEVTNGTLTKVTINGFIGHFDEDDTISIDLSGWITNIIAINTNENNTFTGETTAEHLSLVMARFSGSTWYLDRDNSINVNTPISFTIVGYR